MSFADLPNQPPPIHAAARGYGERILDASRLVQETSRCVLDVAYGDDYWQKLDIYLPARAGPEATLPVLCFLHGGAWRIGYKEWMGFMAPPIVATPAIFVSISYRLAPAVSFPAPLDDCYDALAWVYRNIRKYGGDCARIHVGGVEGILDRDDEAIERPALRRPITPSRFLNRAIRVEVGPSAHRFFATRAARQAGACHRFRSDLAARGAAQDLRCIEFVELEIRRHARLS